MPSMRGSKVWENSWNFEPEGNLLNLWSNSFTLEIMVASCSMASNRFLPNTLFRNSAKRLSFEVSDGSLVEMFGDFPVLLEKRTSLFIRKSKASRGLFFSSWSSSYWLIATLVGWMLAIGAASFDKLPPVLNVLPKSALCFVTTTTCWSEEASRIKFPALIWPSFPFDWSFSKSSTCDVGRWSGEVTSWFSGEGLSASSSTIRDAARRSMEGSCACWNVSALLEGEKNHKKGWLNCVFGNFFFYVLENCSQV